MQNELNRLYINSKPDIFVTDLFSLIDMNNHTYVFSHEQNVMYKYNSKPIILETDVLILSYK